MALSDEQKLEHQRKFAAATNAGQPDITMSMNKCGIQLLVSISKGHFDFRLCLDHV